MSEETKSQEATPQSNEQSAQPTQSDDSVDYKSLYLEEVNNAKKLRKRAQESEATISEFKKNQETDKVRRLKEQEKFKELSENLQSQLDDVSPYKEKWENYESSRRESLLSKLPEEDRESLANESLKTLEYITNKLAKNVASSPAPVSGASRNMKEIPNNPFDGKLEKQDIQRNWQGILDQYTSNHKKKTT
tara:strand:+ start:4892 stop:5464 length:573 start_codon:yes stop_codon:yes gene_type:complete